MSIPNTWIWVSKKTSTKTYQASRIMTDSRVGQRKSIMSLEQLLVPTSKEVLKE